MGALDFVLPVGLPVTGVAAGATTNFVGTTQGDVRLGAWRLTCVDTLTQNVQQDAILSDFRIANQSVFTSSGTGFPAAAMAFNVQSTDEIIGVTLAAGTSVSMSVIGGAAVGGYDAGGSIATDPVGQLEPGQAPGDFSLDSIGLLFPMNLAAIPAALGTTVMQATCNRTCRLGKLFLTNDAANYLAVDSILVGGVEQLAQSTVSGVPIDHFAPTSTFQNEYMDLDVVITPGEQVQISIQNLTAVASNVLGGIYCLPI